MLRVSELDAHRGGRLTDMARNDPKAHAHLVADDGNVAHQRPIVALRVAVPLRLRQDLLTLARRAGKPLSEYCRDTLTTYYLGALWE
jgi:NADPH-dependent 2,4-dienoyl-CoA reductase/sulfur reductase-like enzyme